MEIIAFAGIKYYLKSDPDKSLYVVGKNHSDCIGQFRDLDIPVTSRVISKEVQGFFTSKGRFVNRYTAYDIALSNSQLICENKDHFLYSEYCDMSFTLDKGVVIND